MNEKVIAYVFAPLEVVDAKSLTVVSERLQKSLNKADRAVGSFLLRYVEYKSSNIQKSGKDEDSDKNPWANLRDLK